MDALGHVNNTVYFRYMEQARLEWLYAARRPTRTSERHGPVIANASCNFRIPLVYPGDVEVRMYLGAPGRSSVDSYLRDRRRRRRSMRRRRRQDRVDRPRHRASPTPLPDAHRRAAARAREGGNDDQQALGTLARAHRAGEHHRVCRGASRRKHGVDVARLREAVALVGRPQGGVLARDVGLRRA